MMNLEAWMKYKAFPLIRAITSIIKRKTQISSTSLQIKHKISAKFCGFLVFQRVKPGAVVANGMVEAARLMPAMAIIKISTVL